MAENNYRLVVDATDENLHTVLGFLEEHLEEHDCPFKVIMQISLAIEEAFVNVAHYAYEETGTADFDLYFEDGAVTITMTDSGMAFDPLAQEDPDVSLSAEERGIGGLGILLVKKTMTSVEYKREDDKNILIMRREY